VLSSVLSVLLITSLVLTSLVVAFVIFLIVRYTPIIGRIFEEKPMFLPLRLAPGEEGEEVRFTTADGMTLAGTYLPRRSQGRAGLMVFCHEFLSDRWSYRPYADSLRDRGFDLFTFDFRNHGASASHPDYRPLQWVSDHEVNDLDAALAYLRARPDHDRAGFGLFGISRGGGTALVVGSRASDVWGVITDGAFPTRGTMLAYILRWAQIFVTSRVIYAILRDFAPNKVFSMLSWIARLRAQRRLRCRFPDIERAASRLSPRPWLMIHGAKDAYIGPEIAEKLFSEAKEPKESWIVAKAKHNRCREVEPEAYSARVSAFLERVAPRRLDPAPADIVDDGEVSTGRDDAREPEPIVVPRATIESAEATSSATLAPSTVGAAG
jgi:pimeloyl-ACP methyl ester carboxylesterase